MVCAADIGLNHHLITPVIIEMHCVIALLYVININANIDGLTSQAMCRF